MKKILAILTIVFLHALLLANVPQLMNYQGLLTDADGTVVEDGTYQITFKIFENIAGGTAIWTETQSISTTNGLFNAVLGSENPISSFPESSAWLGITVANNTEMVPRQRIASVGYALIAQSAISATNASTLNGLPASSYLLTSSYKKPFYIRLPNTNYSAANVGWHTLRQLTITVDTPMSFLCNGFFRRESGDMGPLAIQMILMNQQGIWLDDGYRSWRNPSNVNGFCDTHVVFDVNPGTYIVSLEGLTSNPGVMQDICLEVLALPDDTARNYLSYDPTEGYAHTPYQECPLTSE